MTKPLLILTTPLLLLGAALSASAAPHHAAPAKHTKPAQAVPSATPTPQTASPFRDVPPNHWAAQAVETLRKAGIVQGYPSGTDRTGN